MFNTGQKHQPETQTGCLQIPGVRYWSSSSTNRNHKPTVPRYPAFDTGTAAPTGITNWLFLDIWHSVPEQKHQPEWQTGYPEIPADTRNRLSLDTMFTVLTHCQSADCPNPVRNIYMYNTISGPRRCRGSPAGHEPATNRMAVDDTIKGHPGHWGPWCTVSKPGPPGPTGVR